MFSFKLFPSIFFFSMFFFLFYFLIATAVIIVVVSWSWVSFYEHVFYDVVVIIIDISINMYVVYPRLKVKNISFHGYIGT